MTLRPVNSSTDSDAAVGAPPTSADVARRAQVSRATVSYVLNGVRSQKISEKTREAVLRAADELGYRPNLAAQSLASGASKVAILVIPSVHLGEVVLAATGHMTARAAEHGVTLIVHFEGPGNRTVIDVARDLRPRLVVSMFELDERTTRWLKQRQITVASVFGPGGAIMGGDQSGWLQVDHLTSRGHTRIAFADTTDEGLRLVARMRYQVVADACQERGLPAPMRAAFALDGEGAEATLRDWVAAGVTAVAAYNDEVAIAVLAGIRRAGLRCPEDLAVIGVDEMAINPAMDPPLSSISFDLDAVAALYADALSQLLDGTPAHRPEPTRHDVIRLVERASTAGRSRDDAAGPLSR